MFNEASEAIKWIENIEKFEKKHSIERMRKCLDILGNPENSYKIIHVAGTNGKGSVCTFVKSILLQKKYNVGCFVSPYIINFNERIEMNYNYISDSDLVEQANIIYELANKIKEEQNEIITFFEVVTLIALNYFKKMHAEFAIIEVGLGGLLDVTNVINADVSIITNIGYDHMNILGNTLEEIALNKLGIVKENNHLITTVDESLYPLFKEYCISKNASYNFINTEDIFVYDTELTTFHYCLFKKDELFLLDVIGIHQAYNACLAMETVKYLVPDIKLKMIRKGLKDFFWPGRMEKMTKNPRVILDGAHNIHGANALMETINRVYKNRKIYFVLSALKDKETKKMIDLYSNRAEMMIFTEFENPRIKKANVLFEECDIENKMVINNPVEAINYCINNCSIDSVIIVTGSLYFVSYIRPYFFIEKEQ